MEVKEFGRLSDEQTAVLVAGENDPWHAAAFGLEWLPKEYHVGVCDDDGRLLAAAGLVVADVRFGSQPPIPVVGLGGVIVTASHRGRGLGRWVIAEALTRAAAMGPELAMLFCLAPLVGLYRRFDFAAVPGPVLFDQPGGVVEIPAGGVAMWRPLKPGARLPHERVQVVGLPF